MPDELFSIFYQNKFKHARMNSRGKNVTSFRSISTNKQTNKQQQ